MTRHPLEILLLTNFSDYCFRVIPAIAQLAEAMPVGLTLLHAYNPARTSARQARESLDSYFPEADRYASCRRVAVPGPLVPAVQRQLRVDPAHLIVAPASDPIGLPRFGDRSLRAQLVDACGIPVWTMGRGVARPVLQRPIKHVACWLDFRTERFRHLPYAIAFAERFGATLHLLHGLPAIDEGLLMPPGHPERPLDPGRAREEIAQLTAGAPVDIEIHVTQGEGRRTLTRLLRECQADVVFLRNQEGAVSRWLGLGVGLRLGDSAPCPSIYLSDHPAIPVWQLQPSRAVSGLEPRDVERRAPVAPAGVRPAVALADLAPIGLS